MSDPTSPSPYSENKRFEPKQKVELDPPKDDLITIEELSQCNGTGAPIFHPHPPSTPRKEKSQEHWKS